MLGVDDAANFLLVLADAARQSALAIR